MPITLADGSLRIDRVASGNFTEDNLTITGTGGISVSKTNAAFTISGSSTPLSVKKDDAGTFNVGTIDFGEYLTVSESPTGEANVGVSGLVTTNTNQEIFGNKTFQGETVFNGSVTLVSGVSLLVSETLLVEDNIIGLNTNASGTPTLNAGFYVERGTSSGSILFWNESTDHWATGFTADSGSTINAIDNIVYASELLAASSYLASSLTLGVQQDNVSVNSSVTSLDFGAVFFNVTSGVGEAVITLTGVASSADLLAYSGYAEGHFIDTTEIVTISGDAVATANSFTTSSIATYSGFAEGHFIDTTEIVTISGDAVATANSFTTSSIATYSGFAEGQFVNVSGDTMTGFLTLHADPTASGHAVTKQYVDSQVSAATVIVQEGNVTVNGAVQTFDFDADLFVVTSGAGANEVTIALSGIVKTTTNQSVAGDKTFTGFTTASNGLATASGAEPASISASGVEGELRWSDDYLYIAVGTDSWKRTPLSIWS
jgi:hypothetical protein